MQGIYITYDDYKTTTKPSIAGSVRNYCGTDRPDISLRPDYDGPDFNYSFNSMGFRGPELDTSTPALASFGCSHTVGIGIPEETRFASVFAKKLGLINYCFAVNGSDNLSIMRNVTAFLKNNMENTSTKIILVAWSIRNRFSIAVEPKDNRVEVIVPNQNHPLSGLDDLKVLWAEHCADVYALECIKTVDVLCKLAKVKCIQITLDRKPFDIDFKNIASFYKDFMWDPLDMARDLHYGIRTHAMIADNLYDAFTSGTI
jgi:hypothetical protein